MSIGIAIQTYTLRHECQRDLHGTLRRLSEMGYRRIEFDALYAEPDQTDRLLESLGLSVCGLGVVLERLEDHPEQVVAACRALHTRRAFVAFAPRPVDREAAEGLRGRLDAAAAMLEAHGIQLGYHSHSWEFDAWKGDGCPFDVIAQARRIFLEPDLGWLWQAGVDPVQFLREHRGRCPVAHIKDFRTFGDHDSDDAVGSGAVPVQDILDEAPSLGVDTLVVEFGASHGDHAWTLAEKSLHFIESHLARARG